MGCHVAHKLLYSLTVMAHELTLDVNGKAEMFYVGDKPWHGLGTELPNLATSQEAIEAAGLGWQVIQQPVLTEAYEFINSDDQLVKVASQECDTKRINIRQDNGTPLGVVGTQYQILQNVKAFEFMDAITQDKGGPKYETAGSLWGGRKIWMLARVPGVFEVRKDDVVHPYILLSNSHDGSSAVRIQETPIRVVCQNTLNMAIWGTGKNDRKAHVRHSGDIALKVQRVQDMLGIVRHNFEATFGIYQDLAKKELTEEKITSVLAKLFPDTKSDRGRLQRERVRELTAKGLGNGKGTAWDLYNGITELEDHSVPKSDREDTQDRHLNSVWFGSGYDRKADALSVVMDEFLVLN